MLSRTALATARRATGRQSQRDLSSIFSITDEFPGVPSTSPSPNRASTVSSTTLPSGLTVVSEDAASTSTVSLTFPGAGSASELPGEQGAALANKCLAFKSGSGLSSLLITRNLEDDGAVPFATADRYGATVGYTSSPDHAARLVPLLATTCSFEPWDMRDASKAASLEAGAAEADALATLTEQVFSAAYGAQTAAGRPYHSAGAAAPAVRSFRERAYVLGGAVLAATGIPDHGAFVRAVEADLAGAAQGRASGIAGGAAAGTYLGGEARVQAPQVGEAHVALAFEGPEDPALLAVLRHCLGAAGGIEAFAAPGLVGAYASGSGAADALSEAAAAVPTEEAVARATALARAEAAFRLDGPSRGLAEALAGGMGGVADVAASFGAVTVADVRGAHAAMLASKPSLAAVGDLADVPYHATLAQRFS